MMHLLKCNAIFTDNAITVQVLHDVQRLPDIHTAIEKGEEYLNQGGDSYVVLEYAKNITFVGGTFIEFLTKITTI